MDCFFLDALLHPQFVIEKMVGDASGAAVVMDTVNANAIAVAISANHTYLQIALGCLPDASRGFLCRHFGLDEKRLGSEWGNWTTLRRYSGCMVEPRRSQNCCRSCGRVR